MIKLKINGVVVKEFTLHNDSVGFVPYTIDTFATYTRPMYYQPVYQPQPISYIQPSMIAMCANTMPTIEEPVVENKPISLFKTRHIEYDEARIDDNDMPCDTERLAIAGSGSLKNALDRVSITTGNTDYETLYDIGKESEQFLEDTIYGNTIKSLSSTSVSDITRLVVGFVPDTDFDVDSQKTRDWIMSGKASMWVLLEKTLLSNGQVVYGDGAHRFYYEVLGLIKAFCDKYNVIPPSPFNSNVLGTELFIMDCHLNNNHAKRLFHDMSNANRGVM